MRCFTVFLYFSVLLSGLQLISAADDETLNHADYECALSDPSHDIISTNSPPVPCSDILYQIEALIDDKNPEEQSPCNQCYKSLQKLNPTPSHRTLQVKSDSTAPGVSCGDVYSIFACQECRFAKMRVSNRFHTISMPPSQHIAQTGDDLEMLEQEDPTVEQSIKLSEAPTKPSSRYASFTLQKLASQKGGLVQRQVIMTKVDVERRFRTASTHTDDHFEDL